jgi:alkanesulfonate monooxygenase SsuD/methylene tetrahydromethanopterin reductase-like flavin-dependent oxidoreductase (luciferase family)
VMARGFALNAGVPADEILQTPRTAEALGYGSFWVNYPGPIDGLAALAVAAPETARIALGVGVVPLHTCPPDAIVTATRANTLPLDRLLLGVGSPNPAALARVRDGIGALRQHLRTRLYVAALGPRMCRLAGEVADGVLLNWCTPARVATAVTQIAEGAQAAGRRAVDVTVAVYIRAALAPGSIDGARTAAAAYGSYPVYARQFTAMGLDPTDADDVIAGVMLTDPRSATERLEVYRSAGADLPVVYPVLPPGRPSADAARATIEVVAPV